jgi:hypothetical protein
MKPAILLCALLLLTLTAAEKETATTETRPDPWKPVRPLLGKWEGEVAGEPGKGKAEREYAFTLNNKFIHITNKTVYPPSEKNPKGEVHEDVGYISYDWTAKKLMLRQFHVVGFVNQFALDNISEDGGAATFITTAIENIPAGWRAKETYKFINNEEFVETFALAQPGKDFTTYSETKFRRKK